MNVPNKLTVTRLILVPVFFVVFNLSRWFGDSLADLATVMVIILFIVTEATDILDGQIARRRNMVTDLGKVMDPFADTLSHLTYFVCLMMAGIMPDWAFVIIMWREFGILFVRMLMMKTGKAVPANIWGKSKTVLYAVSSILGILFLAFRRWMPDAAWLSTGSYVLVAVFALAAAASVISFLTYIMAIISSKVLSHLSR
ncbi:CDP-diacylglycerol--glycerol-3-phosphate 3-phosphatidyltransferase [Parasphaerochaeta coccoides]|uniref:CDP-diacylglycerol--glycerol-3-phosphate 3-phosphatidyltransferase n=1 Tax=Parasphaerochaeta coccoides (strain ATCC BAA-1237 / DSM 17374 / SPN1) TaxID=760011 RepID=F4GKP6_PARC1|nr:CDP-diacylglycerol--glycerol-3-phosphate 3-phosphatidyltransferase [Parasphaerochaeta coccoides]AEC01455.1 CDP-diacylglycerol/glycerol-3-phosphate 3-phosphatidyltransferase [Parasphaerochaeta coccoides DSM 17374]